MTSNTLYATVLKVLSALTVITFDALLLIVALVILKVLLTALIKHDNIPVTPTTYAQFA